MKDAGVVLSLVVFTLSLAGCVRTPWVGDGSDSGISGDLPPAEKSEQAVDEGTIAAGKARTPAVHRTLKSKAEADEFVKLAVLRQRLTQDLQVLSRVTNEKKAEVDALEQVLGKEFGIDPKKVYQYEAKSRNLFEVKKAEPPAAGTVSTNQVATQRVLLRTIKEGDEEKRFLGLSTRKEITGAEQRSMRLVTEEKKKKLVDVLVALQQKYGIDGKKNYTYDAASMTIREVVKR